MKKKLLITYSYILLSVSFLLSCEDSEQNIQNTQEATLFYKTWVASDGVTSLRIRLNSDGTFLQGDDDGFPDVGSWTWENEDEQIVRTLYLDDTTWYKFENLTTISVVGLISTNKPFEFGEPISFSLSNR